MEITVFKYKSNEWYKDLYSDFEKASNLMLELDDSELQEFMRFVSDEDIHCKKELVQILNRDPIDVLNEWEDYKKEPTTL